MSEKLSWFLYVRNSFWKIGGCDVDEEHDDKSEVFNCFVDFVNDISFLYCSSKWSLLNPSSSTYFLCLGAFGFSIRFFGSSPEAFTTSSNNWPITCLDLYDTLSFLSMNCGYFVGCKFGSSCAGTPVFGKSTASEQHFASARHAADETPNMSAWTR